MINILIKFNIKLIKFYKYLLSPLLGNNCRYIQNCSDYYIFSLNRFGFLKGSFFGIKRILSCHPIKFLGGGSGLEFAPEKRNKKEYNGQ